MTISDLYTGIIYPDFYHPVTTPKEFGQAIDTKKQQRKKYKQRRSSGFHKSRP